MQKIIDGMTGAMTFGVMLIYVILFVAVVVGIIVSIRNRRKEKATGEEDEAKKY